MEIKYTTKGQKVVVIGSLNSQEKIVQEIFIINGSEVPSGEHFVVKSLHDSPAISWEEKRTKEIKDAFEKCKIEYEIEHKRLNEHWRSLNSKLKDKINWAGAFLKVAAPDHFEVLTKWITGEIEWVVVDTYPHPTIEKVDQFWKQYEDKMRLISLFGRSDGDVTYAMGNYSDYSGGRLLFKPFLSYEAAFAHWKEKLLSGSVTWESIKVANENGFDFPTDKKEDFYSKQRESLNRNISKYTEDISGWQRTLDKINQLSPIDSNKP